MPRSYLLRSSFVASAKGVGQMNATVAEVYKNTQVHGENIVNSFYLTKLPLWDEGSCTI